MPVAAARVPDKHWYHDRGMGGRLLGGACAVSTTWIPRRPLIEDVTGLPGGGCSGVRHGDDAVVSLRFADGSLAAIDYGRVEAAAGKEWVEVQAGPHRAVINDFRSAEADGKRSGRATNTTGADLVPQSDDPFRDAVSDDRFRLPLQRYLAEPGDQRFPAAALDDDLQARPDRAESRSRPCISPPFSAWSSRTCTLAS